MMEEQQCRLVSIYSCGQHVNDVDYIEDVEMFVESMSETYSNHAHLTLGGIDDFTTDYTRQPRLVFAVAEDRTAGYLAWEGAIARETEPPEVIETAYYSDSLTSAVRLGPNELTVHYDTIMTAVLEFVRTAQRPTGVEWQPSPPIPSHELEK